MTKSEKMLLVTSMFFFTASAIRPGAIMLVVCALLAGFAFVLAGEKRFTEGQIVRLYKRLKRPLHHNAEPGILQFFRELGVDLEDK